MITWDHRLDDTDYEYKDDIIDLEHQVKTIRHLGVLMKDGRDMWRTDSDHEDYLISDEDWIEIQKQTLEGGSIVMPVLKPGIETNE